jgi:hypothetical protein
VTQDENGKTVYYLYPNVQSDERGTAVAKAFGKIGEAVKKNFNL